MIKKVRIIGLKSLLNVLVNFNKLNICSGINSSGKSTLLQALRMVESAMQDKSGLLDHHGSVEELLFKKREATPGLDVPRDIAIVVDFSEGTFIWETKDSVDSITGEPSKDFTIAIVNSPPAPGEYCYNFLSAARFGPQPYLPLESDKGLFHLGEYGQYVCECLDRYKDLELPNALQHPNSEGRTLEYNVSAWLSDIISGTHVSIRKEKLFDLANTTYNGFRPYNVGFGHSYTLPVIVALLGMPAFVQSRGGGGLLIIENPEAHIHPQGQTCLGKLLTLAATAGVQIIVETHSDYIIDGVRLAIKEGTPVADATIRMDPAHVNFLYFELQDAGFSTITHISANTQGKLANWPAGFFDQGRKNKAKLVGV